MTDRQEPLTHRQQSVNGCVTCERRWDQHTDAEKATGPLTYEDARQRTPLTAAPSPYSWPGRFGQQAADTSGLPWPGHRDDDGCGDSLAHTTAMRANREAADTSGLADRFSKQAKDAAAIHDAFHDGVASAFREAAREVRRALSQEPTPDERDDATYIRAKGRWPEAADTSGLRKRIDRLTKFQMAEWPGQDFVLYEDVAALSQEPTPDERPLDVHHCHPLDMPCVCEDCPARLSAAERKP